MLLPANNQQSIIWLASQCLQGTGHRQATQQSKNQPLVGSACTEGESGTSLRSVISSLANNKQSITHRLANACEELSTCQGFQQSKNRLSVGCTYIGKNRDRPSLL
jgi:hypothetical protein